MIPKDESGYGSKTISLSLNVIDGAESLTVSSTSTTISILSTIPPEPLVGLANDISVLELTDELEENGLDLTKLVRIPGLNDSHVLELVNLPEGVEVKVDSNILNEELIRTNPSSENMKMVRLSSENIDSAKLILPSNILDGTNNLNLFARVGTLDGATSNGTDSRFVYSRFVEFDMNFGNISSKQSDVLIGGNESECRGR